MCIPSYLFVDGNVDLVVLWNVHPVEPFERLDSLTHHSAPNVYRDTQAYIVLSPDNPKKQSPSQRHCGLTMVCDYSPWTPTCAPSQIIQSWRGEGLFWPSEYYYWMVSKER